MRARVRIAEYDMEFEGAPALWNEFLRPIFGGPEADDSAAFESGGSDGGDVDGDDGGPSPPASRPAATGQPDEHTGAPLSVDAAFAELSTVGGRRGEKDAVLLAVWAIGQGTGPVTFDEVASTVHAHEAFRDVRVKPHLLKHVSRSKMLEPCAERETVALTDKGRRYVRALLGS